MPNALIVCGDARKLPFADESVNCCVTSPPYYGLRNYQVEGQLGLEQSPEEYVAQMVAVFREVKRVLRHDGVLWLNLGDSYWGGKGMNGSSKARATAKERGYTQSEGTVQMAKRPTDGRHHTIKPKDLIGIPWMMAFALRADGWYLRQDIIWAKGNPMPESVTDRCTKAHEYLFLLSKSKSYYYDHEAIREPIKSGCDGTIRARARTAGGALGGDNKHHVEERVYDTVKGANKRSVWNVNPKPYKGAHFATFPPKLIEPCILAGCPVGGVVLDPFMGSGTTAEVALQHGRNAVGTELNQSYIKLCHERLSKMKPAVKTTEMGTLFEL